MSPTATKTQEARILVEDLPGEHLAELEFLWARRASMARSFDHFAGHVADTLRRMEANAVGIEVAARPALPLLEEALAGEEASLAAAAAWSLLRIGGERAAKAVTGALEAGPPPARAGVCEAIVFGPAAEVLGRLETLANGEDAAIAAFAAEARAAHGGMTAPRALGAWLGHAEAGVRMAACRVAAWTGAGAEPLEPLARGDEESGVRAAALEAGAWLKAPWALAYTRERAKAKDAARPEALAMFGILAEDADEPAVLALGNEAALGPARWSVLASHGRVACLRACLAGIESKEAADAEAAGRAYVRMTGANPGAAKRVPLPPPADAGPDAEEFADEAFVPDPDVAKKHWEANRERFEKGRRWCRGLDVASSAAASAEAVDMGSRRVLLLRERYRGKWSGSRRELLLLPR